MIIELLHSSIAIKEQTLSSSIFLWEAKIILHTFSVVYSNVPPAGLRRSHLPVCVCALLNLRSCSVAGLPVGLLDIPLISCLILFYKKVVSVITWAFFFFPFCLIRFKNPFWSVLNMWLLMLRWGLFNNYFQTRIFSEHKLSPEIRS